MKYREVTRAIEEKVPGASTGSHERNRWAILEGRKILRVTYPKVHGSDIPVGTLNAIRKQLRLDGSAFTRFVACTMSGREYEQHLRGLLGSGTL